MIDFMPKPLNTDTFGTSHLICPFVEWLSSPADSDTFTFTATNAAGNTMVTFTVTVEGKNSEDNHIFIGGASAATVRSSKSKFVIYSTYIRVICNQTLRR